MPTFPQCFGNTILTGHRFLHVAMAVSVLWIGVARSQAADEGAFAAAAELKPMLKIRWRLGPDYPMGIQDSMVGHSQGMIISAGGFTRHPLNIVARYPDAFGGQANGFTRLTLALDPAHEDRGWQRIADLGGPARQGGAVAVVGDTIYAMGGSNYDEPYTYRDTYRLQGPGGTWTKLESCPLPWPVYGSSGCTAVLGKKIYLLGTADYFQVPGTEGPDFYSERGRDGSPVGSALLVLDSEDLEAGWKRLADCPGLPQFNAGVAAAGGKIWRLGGAYSPLEKPVEPELGKQLYFNAVDSWVYDPADERWSRLPDMPDGANRRPLVYQDRYVLLLAGYKYPLTWHVDQRRTAAYTADERRQEFKAFFEKTVLVFDTQTRRLGTADAMLEPSNYPAATLVGDTIYCLGGEGGPRLYHPATLQIGTIEKTLDACGF